MSDAQVSELVGAANPEEPRPSEPKEDEKPDPKQLQAKVDEAVKLIKETDKVKGIFNGLEKAITDKGNVLKVVASTDVPIAKYEIKLGEDKKTVE